MADELVDETGDNRQSTYLERGDDGTERRIWRASGLGACDRSLVMGALGHDAAPVPAAIQAAYDAGHATEAEILAGMKRKMVDGGWRPLDRHELVHPYNVVQEHGDAGWQVELELDCGSWRGVRQVVRCHPDSIAVKTQRMMWTGNTRDIGAGKSCVDENGARRVVEAKFLRPGTYGTTLEQIMARSRFYAWQFSVEVAASGLGLLVLVGWKADGGQELERLEDPWVLEPADVPYTKGQIKARVLGLARLLSQAEEEGLGGVECDYAMYPCGFYEAGHLGQKVWDKGNAEGGDAAAWWEGLSAEVQQSITWHAGQVEKHKNASKVEDDARKAAAAKLNELLKEHGWDGVASGVGHEGRVVGGWRVTRVVEPAKEAREVVVQYKAREASEYVKVSRVKGAGDGE